MLGYPTLLGTISVGAYADFLVLGDNPLDDVTILDWPERHLQCVVKEGRAVYAASRAEPEIEALFTMCP